MKIKNLRNNIYIDDYENYVNVKDSYGFVNSVSKSISKFFIMYVKFIRLQPIMASIFTGLFLVLIVPMLNKIWDQFELIKL